MLFSCNKQAKQRLVVKRPGCQGWSNLSLAAVNILFRDKTSYHVMVGSREWSTYPLCSVDDYIITGEILVTPSSSLRRSISTWLFIKVANNSQFIRGVTYWSMPPTECNPAMTDLT